MASPALIYAFDNLGPQRFTELCGLLLGSKFRGFILGGVGADGGIDGEIETTLGEWRPVQLSPLQEEVYDEQDTVIFQFKHKVVARVGQSNSRTQLMGLFQCRNNGVCELHKPLVRERNPSTYILVTNVEVNPNFRTQFIERCRAENPDIGRYQIIGLDDLESWLMSEPQIRALYFPTIYGMPRFELRVTSKVGMTYDGEVITLLNINISNIGLVTSYISNVSFEGVQDGEPRSIFMLRSGLEHLGARQQPTGVPLEVGRSHDFNYTFELLRHELPNVILTGIVVKDEIGNVYTGSLPDGINELIRRANN